MDALELDLHLLAQLQVERAERLVEQQHARLEHERTRERDALLLAARELVRAGAGSSPSDAPSRARGACAATLRLAHPALLETVATLSRTDMCGNSAYCWKTVLTFGW